MSLKITTTNPERKKLIIKLWRSKSKLWRRIAKELNKKNKVRREVNVGKIEKHAKEGETIIVPGKVLGNGDVNKRITVAGFKFSKSAENKIKKAGGKTISIEELFEKNKEGKKIKIIG